MNVLLSSDELVIERLRAGDEGAFREIYTKYWKKLFSIALRKIEDRSLVEGIVQDIFLKVWERRETLKVDNLEAYLVTAVKYACINHIKLLMQHERYELHTQHNYADQGSSTEEHMDLTDLISAIDEHLSSFPASFQQIFRLHRLEYMSVKDISKELNIPQRTVELRLSKVVQAMRIYLQDYL